MTEARIPEEIMTAIAAVRPLSASAKRLMETVNRPGHAASDVIDIVSADTGLTAAVLRTVNSAVYGLRDRIETVNRAVSYLGDRSVVSLAIRICAGDLYQQPLAGYHGEPGDLWQHCLHTAIAARAVAQHARTPLDPDLAYTAGLLHDIGKAVLNAWLVTRSGDLVPPIDERDPDFLDRERSVAGTDHPTIGAVLAHRWGLGRNLCYAIAFHHHPTMAPQAQQGLTYAVHLGDFLAMMGGHATGADAMMYPLDSGYDQHFQLDPLTIDRLMFASAQEYQRLAEALQ